MPRHWAFVACLPEGAAEKINGPAWRKHQARRQLHVSNGQPPDNLPSSHRITRIACIALALALAPARIIADPDSADIASAPRPTDIASARPRPADIASASPSPPTAAAALQDLPPLELHGVRAPDSRLFKLRGWFAGQMATILLDSGASDQFIDTDFARRCGYTLTASDRTIRLADGSIVKAAGCTTATCSLAAAKGSPVPFEANFTATSLESYDAILGMTWLADHDPLIGWRDRSITLRTPGRPHRLIRPLESLSESPEVAHIATVTCKGLQKAHRKGEVEELYLVRLNSIDTPAAEAGPAGADDRDGKPLLTEFADVFPAMLPNAAHTPNRGVEHRIDLKPNTTIPPSRPLRHQSAKAAAAMRDYVQAGVESGQIQVSQSPYGSMALWSEKKDGTPRVVIDYRALNERDREEKYPLPLMDELFDRVQARTSSLRSTCARASIQIKMRKEDREKTAFRTRFGSFEYTVLPMGLCNAPGTFMQLMNETFRDMLDRCVLGFLDDILVFSRTREEHVKHVREVLTRLREQKLYVKLSASVEFFQQRGGIPRPSHRRQRALSVAGQDRRRARLARPQATALTCALSSVWRISTAAS